MLFELEAGTKRQINLAIEVSEIDLDNPGAWAITGVASEGKHGVRQIEVVRVTLEPANKALHVLLRQCRFSSGVGDFKIAQHICISKPVKLWIADEAEDENFFAKCDYPSLVEARLGFWWRIPFVLPVLVCGGQQRAPEIALGLHGLSCRDVPAGCVTPEAGLRVGRPGKNHPSENDCAEPRHCLHVKSYKVDFGKLACSRFRSFGT